MPDSGPVGSPLHLDPITAAEAGTLHGLLQRRTARSPDSIAYRQYEPEPEAWIAYTWQQVSDQVGRWRQALAGESLAIGDRVAILLRNSVGWVCFDQAALSLGLVVVPLYTWDSPGNIAYILSDSGARLLLVGEAGQWQALAGHRQEFPALERVLCLEPGVPEERDGMPRVSGVSGWLDGTKGTLRPPIEDPHALATIIYTSGTTGRPKGVMLSHHNILWNAEAVFQVLPGYREDVFLSHLPLSHAFERTGGCYFPMMAGSEVAFARSPQQLPEDLLTIRPTVLLSVPRVYEKVYARVRRTLQEKGWLARLLFRWTVAMGWRRFQADQGRRKAPGNLNRFFWPLLRRGVADRILAGLGGRIRVAISGAAPLDQTIARRFVALGLPLLEGYGLTEAAPGVSINRLEDNLPGSVGAPFPGVEVTIGPEGELLIRSPGVMQSYWNRPDETRTAVDEAGWLHTGDIAEIRDGRLFIRGRLKEIIVTSTGKKVALADLEMALAHESLFAQAMVVGEGMPYIGALLVLEPTAWQRLARRLSLDPDDKASLASPAVTRTVLKRCKAALRAFPAHAQVRAVSLTLDPWTIDNGLLTPTLKLKRGVIARRYAAVIRALYAGHEIPG